MVSDHSSLYRYGEPKVQIFPLSEESSAIPKKVHNIGINDLLNE